MIKSITSAQNQWVKDVLELQEKAKNRRTAGQFTVEGINEIRLAMKSGLIVKQLAINPDKMSWKELNALLNLGKDIEVSWMIEVLGSAWSKVVVRESGQNALAIFEMPSKPLEWKPKPGGLYLLVESVEKPGNLGALLRSADATAADGVVICDERIDAYHPHGTSYSPMMCVFTQPFWRIQKVFGIWILRKQQQCWLGRRVKAFLIFGEIKALILIFPCLGWWIA